MTAARPRVSVVVPTYNSVAFIGATMDSILSQTFGDFELVVSDHSSTDGTWEKLQPYLRDPRVRLYRLPAGGGAAANWNSVTDRAAGELLKLVCGDDLIYPDNLALQVAALDAHPGAVMAAARRDIVDATGRPLVRGRGLGRLNGVVSGPTAIRATVRAGTNLFGEPASVLLRRELFAEVGRWDADQAFLIDEASYIRVLRRGDLVALPLSLAGFRVSDQQWSVALMRTQAAEAAAYHQLLATTAPGLLGRSDLRVGAVLARANALLRRAAYSYLRRRTKRATGLTTAG